MEEAAAGAKPPEAAFGFKITDFDEPSPCCYKGAGTKSQPLLCAYLCVSYSMISRLAATPSAV